MSHRVLVWLCWLTVPIAVGAAMTKVDWMATLAGAMVSANIVLLFMGYSRPNK